MPQFACAATWSLHSTLMGSGVLELMKGSWFVLAVCVPGQWRPDDTVDVSLLIIVWKSKSVFSTMEYEELSVQIEQ